MEMSALIVLIAVMVGGAVGGALGMLLAIPVTACCKILFEELRNGRPPLAAVTTDRPSKITEYFTPRPVAVSW